MQFKRLGSEWTLRTCCFVVRVLGMADGLDGWDDVLRVVDGPVSEGRRPYLRPKYVVCRQFDEEGILPRTSESRRHERESADVPLGVTPHIFIRGPRTASTRA